MHEVPFTLSTRALQTEEQPITFFMRRALENPDVVSLAAGFVDNASLPAAEVREAIEQIFAHPRSAQSALQYGITQGYAPLREKILHRLLALDSVTKADVKWSIDDLVITSGSQQLLYLVAETLLDPGDIVIAEAPSYFVYNGVLKSFGARVLTVPMDDQGMITDALEDLLEKLESTGELPRVKMIYTVDYFQNPSGLTLSLPRRQHLLEIAQRFSKQHRIFILEDAAYRELRFEGGDIPSIKSFDHAHEHVILGMTFSKPMSPGLKTGYGLLPRDLVGPLLRFKGNHDFGSSNLNQHILDHVMGNGSYERHVETLCRVYKEKRDAMLGALTSEFRATAARWTRPEGGLYVWLSCPPEVETGPGSALMEAALQEGVLYIPGSFCHAPDEAGNVPNHEARLSFGVASPDQIREGIRRLARAAEGILPRTASPGVAHCRA